MKKLINQWQGIWWWCWHSFNADILGPQTKMTTALTTVLHDLLKFTNYSVELLAFTRVGDGVKSRRTFCRTKEDGKYYWEWGNLTPKSATQPNIYSTLTSYICVLNVSDCRCMSW